MNCFKEWLRLTWQKRPLRPAVLAKLLFFQVKFLLGSSILWLAIVFQCAQALAAGADKPTLKALKLSQIHYYFGDCDTVIASNGLRINNRGSMKFCLVAKAPKWDFCVFRDDDKTCFPQSLKWLSENGIVNDFIVMNREKDVKGEKAKNAKICNTTVKHIEKGKIKLDILPLPAGFSAQLPTILHYIYKIPNNGELAIRYSKPAVKKDWLSGEDRTGRQKILFDTVKIEEVLVPKNYFDAPLNYRKLLSIQEVLVSKERRDATVDLDEIFLIKKK
ncbi:MAG: hypothetical protein K2Y32_23285 [Candidatus Obscuribacterales bacterium]|nr:hypothetical protein [Candidatus Obscuribacterales bacterium]